MQVNADYDNHSFLISSPKTGKGHHGNTTSEQDAQVLQLRSLLEVEGYEARLDTITLLRFLRARKFVIQDAKQMFVNCEKWRSEFSGGVDNLVRDFEYKEKKEVSEIYPQFYHKTDVDGRPVYIERLGKVSLERLNEITTEERMLQNLVFEYEKLADSRLSACSRKAGHLVETCCTVMDVNGVGIFQIKEVLDYLKKASSISQNYYPERLGKLYIINAPWGFPTAFGVVKHFLDPVTVEKISILGRSFHEELFKQVPKADFPKDLGGECCCDGGCHLSDMGPWKLEEYTQPLKCATPDAVDGNRKPVDPDLSQPPGITVSNEKIPSDLPSIAIVNKTESNVENSSQ